MVPEPRPKLPSLFTVARETEDAINSPFCQIWIQKGANIPSKLATRIQMEWFHSPYRSRKIERMDALVSRMRKSIPCCIVYVRVFTNSGHDFVYCVFGNKNLPRFFAGTYGARNYEGPTLAALVVLAGTIMEKVGPIDWREFKQVPKHGGKLESVRWRYLFATAVWAWDLMTFSPAELPTLKAILADAPAQQHESEPEVSLPEPISAGNTHPEAQRIAINQTLELLKKKPNHHERVFDFLEAELRGRRRRQEEQQLTTRQRYLLERLRDNADDFEFLYEDKKENGGEPSAGYNAEEAHLISKRDDLIREIQTQLALPITLHSDFEESESASSDQLHTSTVPENPENIPNASGADRSRGSGETTNKGSHTKEQAHVIQEFAEYTGATPHQAEGYLITANWDLEIALMYFYEDRPGKKPAVSFDTDTKLSQAQQDALVTFKSLTNADSAVAEGYLVRALWDVDRAVTNFFDDSEASTDDNPSDNECPNAMCSTFSVKIRERPVEHISVGTNDATKRQALGPVGLSADFKAAIRDRIEELKAEISDLSETIQTMENERANSTMHDVTEGGTGSTPGSKTRTVTPDKSMHASKPPTLRIGVSHAGLPLLLDASGNALPRVHSTFTPYEQYLAMRVRLQVQNYGHEAIPSSQDPHRGVPTRERCPAPFVQEQSSDSDDGSSSASEDADPPAAPEPTAKEMQVKKEETERRLFELKNFLAAVEVADAGLPNKSASPDEQEPPTHPCPADNTSQSTSLTAHAEKEGDDDEADSIPSDADQANEDENNTTATSTQTKHTQPSAALKPALKPPHSRKPSMNVRFNLGDERNLPTTWDERAASTDADADTKTTTLPRRSDVGSGTPAANARCDAGENGEGALDRCDDRVGESVGEEGGGDGEMKSPEGEDGKGGEKMGGLLASKEEEDGGGLDCAECEPESKAKSDGDVGDGQERVEAQLEKRGRSRRRVDEVMEDCDD